MAHGEATCELVGNISYCIPNGFFDFFGVQCSLLLVFPFLYAIRSNVNEWFERSIISRLIKYMHDTYDHQVDTMVGKVEKKGEAIVVDELKRVHTQSKWKSDILERLESAEVRESVQIDKLSHYASTICALLFIAYLLYFWSLVSHSFPLDSAYKWALTENIQEDSEIVYVLNHENILLIPHALMSLGAALYLYISTRLVHETLSSFTYAIGIEFSDMKKWCAWILIFLHFALVAYLLYFCWTNKNIYTSWLLTIFIFLQIVISYLAVYCAFILHAFVMRENARHL